MPKSADRSALDYFPSRLDYDPLKDADGCKGCDIYLNATQTVFGEGNLHPQIAQLQITRKQRRELKVLACAFKLAL
jgi:hypothetical protein